MKKVENCEGRKLDFLDCKPVRKYMPSGFLKSRGKRNESTKDVLFIPDSTQGYLFTLGKFYRFGLPPKNNMDYLFVSLVEDQNKNIHCCETKKAVVLSDYKHDLYSSPLHQVRAINETGKDLETILAFNDYQVSGQAGLNSVLKRFGGNALIAMVVFEGRFGTPDLKADLNCWAWEIDVGSKTDKRLVVDDLDWQRFGRMGINRDRETRLLFDTLKNELTGVFYPQKVKDVLGDFDL
jgi:hypothetical protein